MEFRDTDLAGACLIVPELRSDDRGFFARTFCQREFEAHGLRPTIAQVSIAANRCKGTIRGMHFQYPPAAETKVVRCVRGAVLDVIIDLRPESPTFLRHTAVELTDRNRWALYVPERFAHGYQSLTDETELVYEISEFYAPELSHGLRYSDPALRIPWPLAVSVISDRDRDWALITDTEADVTRRMAVGTPPHQERTFHS